MRRINQDKQKLKSQIIKEKICMELDGKIEDNDKCFLLIVPFSERINADGFIDKNLLNKFNKNLIKVNKSFYDEILERYYYIKNINKTIK